MSLNMPVIYLKKTYLNILKEKTLKIELKNMTKDYFLVIDAYPVDNPRHPERHFGWYRFDDLVDGEYSFNINIKNMLEISSIDKLKATDFWLLSNRIEENKYPISLKLVIRKKINNELIYENKLLVVEDENYLDICKNKFEEFNKDFKEVLPIKYIIPMDLEVKIVLKSFVDKDAIGYFVKQIYSLLSQHNVKVKIYTQYVDDYMRPFVYTIDDLLQEKNENSKNVILLYNYSIADKYIDEIIALPYKKIVYYHGITEPSKLKVFDALLARECQKGIDDIYKLIYFDEIISNSKKTQIELLRLIKDYLVENVDIDPDFEKQLSLKKINKIRDKLRKKNLKKIKEIKKKCKYLPPVIIQKSLWDNIESDGQFEKSLLEIGNIILFVGRIFPHKKIEEIIDIFKEYLKLDKNGILVLVGGTHNSYQKYLQYKIEKFSEAEKERIIFMQNLSVNQLKAVYKAAKVFITMSEDEGFCVPILEAMNFELPIIAKLSSGTACEELLGQSGKLIIDNLDKKSIAKEVYRLIFNTTYRQAVITKQNIQLKIFDDEILSEDFLNMIMEFYYADKSNS